MDRFLRVLRFPLGIRSGRPGPRTGPVGSVRRRPETPFAIRFTGNRDGSARCRIGELAPGASTSVNALLSPTEARTLQLRSLLASTTSDPYVSDNDIVTAFTPIPPTANLSVSLNDTPNPAQSGLP